MRTGITDPAAEEPVSAERMKAFTDAVVAIAMTLLILPLLETVSDGADEGQSTVQWLGQNFWPLFAFILSFVVIANFWVSHHQLFARVERVSHALLWITIGWMLTIVWLPVVTAMVGQVDSDVLQKVLYIGTMAISCIVLLFTRVYLRAHRELHDIPDETLRRDIGADALGAFMFLVCLLVAVFVPWISYSAMFLMILLGPLERAGIRARRRTDTRG